MKATLIFVIGVIIGGIGVGLRTTTSAPAVQRCILTCATKSGMREVSNKLCYCNNGMKSINYKLPK